MSEPHRSSRYDVAVLIDGTEWSANMPEAGQRDIVDFVSGGGGLVSVEWVAWEIGAAGRFLTIAEVVPVSYGGSWSTTASTYTRRTAHPIASTLPAVFSVGSHGWSSSALRAGATELYTLDAAGTPGLATWERDLASCRERGHHVLDKEPGYRADCAWR